MLHIRESSQKSGLNERDRRLCPLESTHYTEDAKNYFVFTMVNRLPYGP